MYADAIAGRNVFNVSTDFFDPAGDFVPECYGQTVNPGNAGAIMFVGMADPARCNPDQNVGRTDFRKCDLRFLQRLSDLSESHRSHSRQRYSRFECTLERKNTIAPSASKFTRSRCRVQRISASNFLRSSPASR